ncbi:MAG TPA: hypothetical protein VED40_14780 [Azospirillaceae bacterium]|nr:hypothetical protein [Azospirillaceae bacterium]
MTNAYAALAERPIPSPAIAGRPDGSTASSETVAEAVVGHFFALDTERRVAWPIRVLKLADDTLLAERWRFGRWVKGAELAAFLNGEDDLWTEATAEEVEAWIGREMRRCGLSQRARALAAA